MIAGTELTGTVRGILGHLEQFAEHLGKLHELRFIMQILGNFREPGLNLAGTLTYHSPASAEKASKNLSSLRRSLEDFELLMTALNIPPPIHRMKAQATGKDTQVVAEIDGRALAKFFENANELLAGTEASEWFPN